MDDRPPPKHHANRSRSLFVNPSLTPRSTPPLNLQLHLRPPIVVRRPSRTRSVHSSTPASASASASVSADSSRAHTPDSEFTDALENASMVPAIATAVDEVGEDEQEQGEEGWAWAWNWSIGLPSLPLAWAHEHPDAASIQPVSVVAPSFFPSPAHDDCVQATWLGHASWLVTLPTTPTPTRILCDPLFSARAGPTPYTGVRRRLPAPCTVEDLPDFHFIVISHNHYDHLDLPTQQRIRADPRRKHVRYLVPLGLKSFFTSSPLSVPARNVFELDWHDAISLPADARTSSTSAAPRSLSTDPRAIPNDPGVFSNSPQPTLSDEDRGARYVTFTCTPAQHNSGRALVDSRATLWASWVFAARCRASDTAGTSAAFGAQNADNDAPLVDSPVESDVDVLFTPRPADADVDVPFTPRPADADTPFTPRPADVDVDVLFTPRAPHRRPPPSLKERRIAVYFAGDTGLMTPTGPCPIFDEIGEKYGPFDLALLPIWRGGTLSFVARLGLRIEHDHPSTLALTSLHATPAHAVYMHAALRARRSLAMHFATFAGSDAEAREPLVELVQARRAWGATIEEKAEPHEDDGPHQHRHSRGPRRVKRTKTAPAAVPAATETTTTRRAIGPWTDEGGFGWIDVGRTAVVPLDGRAPFEVP